MTKSKVGVIPTKEELETSLRVIFPKATSRQVKKGITFLLTTVKNSQAGTKKRSVKPEHAPIDFERWVTQATLAKELTTSVARVCNWTRRGKIQARPFPQLNGQVLVDRTTVNIKTMEDATKAVAEPQEEG